MNWKEKSLELQAVLTGQIVPNVSPLESGLEADVYKISTPDSDFVLKIWNRDSKPDISSQYKVLERLFIQGNAVSKPLGWGFDEKGNQVLLTSYDGAPIHKINKLKLTEIAKILMSIHKLGLDHFDPTPIPRYDFIEYFFPGTENQSDIKEIVVQLIEDLHIKQQRLIHGDYNLRNVLENGGKYTIIDWTNVQLGDPRYDMAWSIILIWIYTSERYAYIYRSVFLANNCCTEDELEKFEAIACLRWILLNRTTTIPMERNTISLVRTIVSRNKYLNKELIMTGRGEQ
ncbi:aminoglycoside phosphotransferase family protein [Paenibacillus sp. sgz500958]|uniref:aminoglycoside phosphotransferase family protein n=1 Tax=Paenibacillus sp. sgz500958 TaxID=3242475 RepID=UPI0036D331D2